jgi:pyrroline-5-carboxylate reductase
MQADPTVGVIGIGNMSRSIVDGMVADGWDPENVVVTDVSSAAIERARGSISESLGVADDVVELQERSDVVMVGVNPFQIGEAMAPINDESMRLISIAAGVSIADLEAHTGPDSEIVRVMPNTPSQVGYGMSFVTPGPRVADDFMDVVESMFEAVGETLVIEEDMMDAGTAVAGSGPAYVFYFLEALQYAAIYVGFDEDTALELATQTLLGGAQLAAQSDATPGELQQEVASPGGTTIEALKYLDETATAGNIQEAVNKCWEKSKRMH